MSRWGKITLASLGVVGLGCGLAIGASSTAWNRKTAQMIERLFQPNSQSKSNKVSFKDFNSLPAPVARYFRFALTDGQPLIRIARIQQQGEFRLNDKWIPFEATQHFSASPPGMVWDAGMKMNPLLNVRVRDAYVAGQGSMQAKALSLLSVVDEHDKAELNVGAMQRYLAEASWLPTALLPSENLKWGAVDEHRALATLTDSGNTVSLEFSFNEAGEIAGVFTPGRYREANGKYELTPWAGYHRNYRRKDGMCIPLESEVEWQLPSGRMPYCKLKIVNVEYEFAR